MNFVDTNYFLRHLLQDNSIQSKKARKIFTRASRGQVKLFTSQIVIFEIYWVLKSFYGLTEKKVLGIIQTILSFSFIEIENVDTLNKAVIVAIKSSQGLEDSYNLVYSKLKNADGFVSFDKKLIKYFG